ncbi:hypothetical protein WJX73_001379 [Symbiochloris irregularis]|uniref:FAD-binding PCMH-type domain-containing protein n=1 Tax=Symbiochloris irregularis TaxID=706552 RepID=A0AAW1P8F9_9CHLO
MADLQGALSAGSSVLTASNAPAAFGKALQGFHDAALPADYGRSSAVVVQPAGIKDIQATVRFAVDHSLPVAVKGGGSSARPDFQTQGGITIDMSRMRTVTVDAAAAVMIAQGGAVYKDMAEATQPYDLALPWGDSYGTGFGLALGGGIGYLSRAKGLTADHIINATIVLANGSVIVASGGCNPDLLAAVKGAGTVFGVVVEAAFKLQDVSGLFGGYVAAVDDNRGTVFRSAHQWAAKAMADEPTLGVEISAAVGTLGPGLPPHNQAVIYILVALPKHATANKTALLAPLRQLPYIIDDTLGQLDWYGLESVVYNISNTFPYSSRYFIGGLVSFKQADDDFMDLLFNMSTHLPPKAGCLYLSDYLGSSVSENAVKNTTSFTPFAGDKDFHFFIMYAWAPGTHLQEYSDIQQQNLAAFSSQLIAPQAYANLATVTSGEYLQAQVGGARNLASSTVGITNDLVDATVGIAA